ncbi:MAG: bifunctional glutamate N-acetyltransferase/amino-acid acetyltransferase ArgJ [Candidatus Hydrogenedentes bacterium]|nr:bifunctional glutamate N-acetyltransferase/amino-acid acetyltransferase ArgJ [Candidatus Hydrogenedentota bacterium]
MKAIEGGVCAPKGFRASGVAAGIKEGSTKKDCALVVSDNPCAVAGMFTTNVMKSPPVYRDQEVCERGRARAVFLNSGNANAATGVRGHQDMAATVDHVANALGVPAEEVCICSTGVIGVPLPMDRIAKGIDGSVDALSEEGSLDAATAIMTTDTEPKSHAVEIEVSGGTVRLGAIAKGAGMVSPKMATMICIITTDAAFESADDLRPLVADAVEHSFNRISIDNDMSTSDTVLVLANGASGTAPLVPESEDYEAFGAALKELSRHMAKWLVRDGEGATKFVEISVSGTATDDEAKTIARAIGNSQLCKIAFFGEDPNWGRFACAVGYAGVDFDPGALDIYLDGMKICDGGLAADYEESDAVAIMKQSEYQLRVSVGSGPGEATFWTSDLSHNYVSINADYRT